MIDDDDDEDDDDDDDECRAVGGMIDTGNRSTQIKSASMSICPPQIPHDQTRIRTRAARREACD
jgi:hypothetical protein